MTPPVIAIWQTLREQGVNPPFNHFVAFLRSCGIHVKSEALRKELAERGLLTGRMSRGALESVPVKIEFLRTSPLRTASVGGWRHIIGGGLRLPAVYAIYADGALMYVGSAINLRGRLRGHECIKRLGNRSITVKARYCGKGSFDQLTREARLICRLQPPLNRAYRAKA